MSHVTILGTGAMGSRMASNLIAGGHQVTVWNRDRIKLAKLTEAGAVPAESPASAVKEAEYVISMVRDDEASYNVWLGYDGGALSAMPREAVAIESSTLTVDWIKKLSIHCSKHSIAFLDAPVAGSRPQAEAAQLIFLVGGEVSVYEKAKSLLLDMGGAVHHTGPSGSGAAVKLMVNSLLGIQLAAIGELIGFIRQMGFDDTKAINILASTPVCSPAAKVASEAMLKGNFSPLFPIELVAKDFAYVEKAAESVGVQMPLSKSAKGVFDKAVEASFGQDNITGVVQLYK
jgi:3-hydroxyisobutyrate dehydrogenase